MTTDLEDILLNIPKCLVRPHTMAMSVRRHSLQHLRCHRCPRLVALIHSGDRLWCEWITQGRSITSEPVPNLRYEHTRVDGVNETKDLAVGFRNERPIGGGFGSKHERSF